MGCMSRQGFHDKVAFVWKVADKLRGIFKQHEYGSVILPLHKQSLIAAAVTGGPTPRPPHTPRRSMSRTRLARG